MVFGRTGNWAGHDRGADMAGDARRDWRMGAQVVGQFEWLEGVQSSHSRRITFRSALRLFRSFDVGLANVPW